MTGRAVENFEVIAALEVDVVQLRVDVRADDGHSILRQRFNLSPQQARTLAATLESYARLVEQPREC